MVTNLNSNKDRKHIIKQIKKCIVLNLEDRIYGSEIRNFEIDITIL
jgi:hypothetical protein